MQIEIPNNLKTLSDIFPQPLYVVGGYIRNCLLGLKNQDIDIWSSLTIHEVA